MNLTTYKFEAQGVPCWPCGDVQALTTLKLLHKGNVSFESHKQTYANSQKKGEFKLLFIIYINYIYIYVHQFCKKWCHVVRPCEVDGWNMWNGHDMITRTSSHRPRDLSFERSASTATAASLWQNTRFMAITYHECGNQTKKNIKPSSVLLPFDTRTDENHPNISKFKSSLHMSNINYDIYDWIVGQLPIGSMYAIYGNIYHKYTPFMLVYIAYMDPRSYGLLLQYVTIAHLLFMG